MELNSTNPGSDELILKGKQTFNIIQRKMQRLFFNKPRSDTQQTNRLGYFIQQGGVKAKPLPRSRFIGMQQKNNRMIIKNIG